MALTLVEAAKLSNDVLVQGVIETIVKDDPLLEILPWIPVVGNALTYNQENAASGAAWYDPNETWLEQTPTFTQLTANLRIAGGDADIDNFIKRTRSNVNDLEADMIMLKAKAVREEIRNSLINGNNSTNPKQPDGLPRLIPAGQEVFCNGAVAGNGATLTMNALDRLIDQVRGPVDIFLMSRRSRRKLTGLFRASGSGVLPIEKTSFGNFVMMYNTVPVATSDYIGDAETVGASVDCSTIYAIQFGEGAFAGITASPSVIEVERVGNLETKDATRTRVKSYVAWALFNSIRCAKLTGVRD